MEVIFPKVLITNIYREKFKGLNGETVEFWRVETPNPDSYSMTDKYFYLGVPMKIVETLQLEKGEVQSKLKGKYWDILCSLKTQYKKTKSGDAYRTYKFDITSLEAVK